LCLRDLFAIYCFVLDRNRKLMKQKKMNRVAGSMVSMGAIAVIGPDMCPSTPKPDRIYGGAETIKYAPLEML
jgi:hypothetical protein